MLKGGSYCVTAQRPFQRRSDAEIDATPMRVLRYIEQSALIWQRLWLVTSIYVAISFILRANYRFTTQGDEYKYVWGGIKYEKLKFIENR